MSHDARDKSTINWNRVIQREVLGFSAVVPFLEEAGTLLWSAAELWVGRLGIGRKRATEIRGHGDKLVWEGEYLFSLDLKRTADFALSPELDALDGFRQYLRPYKTHRSYSRRNPDVTAAKNGETSK